MDSIFKKRTIDLMFEKRISQSDLALAIGITQATLSRNLNGVHEPKAEVIKKIADYFSVSVDFLLGNTNDRSATTTDVEIAFYNQHGIVNEEQKKEIESFIKFIKAKNEK